MSDVKNLVLPERFKEVKKLIEQSSYLTNDDVKSREEAKNKVIIIIKRLNPDNVEDVSLFKFAQAQTTSDIEINNAIKKHMIARLQNIFRHEQKENSNKK